jgi:Zn-finger nucleic acid-binding protein
MTTAFPAVTPAATAAMRCPKCHGDMATYERSGVVLDQCRECRGIFLDRGELERLVDAESGGAGWSGPRMNPPAPMPLPVPGGDPFRDRVIDPRAAYRSEWLDDDDDRRRYRDDDRRGYRDHDDDRRPSRRRSLLGELLEGFGD